jgi:hypothetical protein
MLTFMQYVQLSEVFYILTTTMLKVSLGLFFLRILTKRWQKLLFHILLGVSATYGFIYVLTAIFACGNPAKIADTLLGSKHCLPSAFILGSGYLYGTLNVIADWTFVLVAVGSISSIMRMVYLRGLILVPTALSRMLLSSFNRNSN